MYEDFFQLRARPFTALPLAERFYPGRAIESARQALKRCIERAEGVGLVVGPPGSGKTLLVQVLAAQFRDQFEIAHLSNGHLTTRRALLQAISFELGLPYRGLDEGELRLSLIDHLAPGARCPRGMLLLIDEAQRLPMRLMEELRMITNLVRANEPRVRLVLAGGATLEERLARPELESFSQRLAVRCYLEALDRGETAGYVRSQIAALGGEPDRIFTSDALENIYHATGGVPRLINQLCDHALVLAFAGGRSQIDRSGIGEAWSDLQQLPTPWNESAREKTPAATSNVIEFGDLSDEPLEQPSEAIEIGADIDPFEDESGAPVTIEPVVAEIESPLSIEQPIDEPQIDTPTAASLRIDSISAHLTRMEQEELGYMPAFRPLSFTASAGQSHPFGEPFAEEEVVVDRYATADALAAQPHVNSAEGHVLSALLDSLRIDVHGQRPVTSIESSPPSIAYPATFEAYDEGDHDSHRDHEESPVLEINPDHDPVMPEDSWEFEPVYEPQPVPAEPHTLNVARTTEDDEAMPVIIVEDDPQVIHTVHTTPVARRQEYRRLFATLRRG